MINSGPRMRPACTKLVNKIYWFRKLPYFSWSVIVFLVHFLLYIAIIRTIFSCGIFPWDIKFTLLIFFRQRCDCSANWTLLHLCVKENRGENKSKQREEDLNLPWSTNIIHFILDIRRRTSGFWYHYVPFTTNRTHHQCTTAGRTDWSKNHVIGEI